MSFPRSDVLHVYLKEEAETEDGDNDNDKIEEADRDSRNYHVMIEWSKIVYGQANAGIESLRRFRENGF